MKMYQVPEDQLIESLENQMLCNALQAGGVDNWCWYGESISNFIDDYLNDNNLDISAYDVDLNLLAHNMLKTFTVVKGE